ncbi:MAG TPA: hypothetical protein VE152_00565 [Acidimicrobiales bacterium]|nr:hypothetical protein [Acidimicrobiales bacterium]
MNEGLPLPGVPEGIDTFDAVTPPPAPPPEVLVWVAEPPPLDVDDDDDVEAVPLPQAAAAMDRAMAATAIRPELGHFLPSRPPVNDRRMLRIRVGSPLWVVIRVGVGTS